jgi:Fe2+ transport system protein FeoA
MMHAGQTVTVVEIHGGPGFVRRMQEMGFIKGEKIMLLNTGHPGPVRVKIKGSTVAIGHGLARKIMVA